MKKIGLGLTTALAMTAGGQASAALLNPTFAPPLIVYNNQGVLGYDATSDTLTIDANPLIYISTPPGVTVIPGAMGEQVFVQVRVDDAGNLIGGNPGDDFVVSGLVDSNGNGTADPGETDGVLLTGEVLAYGFSDSGGTTDFHDFVFQVTGGALAADWSGQNIGMTVQSEMSDFTGSFATDFSGESKGNVFGTCDFDVTPPALVCETVLEAVDCPCDVNDDGAIDTLDRMLYLNDWFAGDADYDGDADTDINDLFDFLSCVFDTSGNCGENIVIGEDCCRDNDGDRQKIAILRMQYTGTDCTATSTSQDPDKVNCEGDPNFALDVFIKATNKENPFDDGAKVFFTGPVTLGQSFDIDARNGDREALESKTFIHIFSDAAMTDVLQSNEIHTSCSQPLFTGDQVGAARVVGCVGEDEVDGDGGRDAFECETITLSFDASDNCSTPTVDAVIETECETISVSDGQTVTIKCFEPRRLGRNDVCEDEKPAVLTFRYTGEDCDKTFHTQDSGKVSCEGDPAFAANVFIRASNKEDPEDTGGRNWFEGNVNLGDSFDMAAANAGESHFNSASFIHIFDTEGGTLLQTVEFHTSCSQPLELGNQFGASVLIGYVAENNGGSGQIVECGSEVIDGVLTITTSSAVLRAVATDAAGNEAECETVLCQPRHDIGDIDDCCADGDKPVALELLYTGEDCSYTLTSQDADKVSCSGDPAFAPNVFILASDHTFEDLDHGHARTYFAGEVNLDESFLITAAAAGEDKFQSKTFVHIFTDASMTTRLQSVEFHTSCSQPLFTGDQYGSLIITDCIGENDPVPGACCLDDVTCVQALPEECMMMHGTFRGAGVDCATVDCSIVNTDCCSDDAGKPRILAFDYTGDGCGASSNDQDSGKFECNDSGALPATVYILATNKDDPTDTGARVWHADTVNIGDTWMMDAANGGETRFNSASFIYIYDAQGGTLLQSVEFHTSCSQPLFLGDQYGANLLTGCIGEDQ